MRKYLTLGIASVVCLTAAAASGPAQAAPRDTCSATTINLDEASELAQLCDLTGFTVALPSGLTLVVPEAGLYVTASNTSEAGATPIPETSLLNVGNAIAVAEESDAVFATSSDAEEQLNIALNTPPPEVDLPAPNARDTSPRRSVDGERSARTTPDFTTAAIDPSSPKCTATTAYTLQAKWGLAEYRFEWVYSSAPSDQHYVRAEYGMDSVMPGWSPNTCGNKVNGLRYLGSANNSSKSTPGVTPSGCGSRDSVSVHGFGDISGTALARTCSWNSINGFKQEADILFDKTSRSWYTKAGTTGCVSGSYDLEGVALHEAMHAVGLGHTSNQTQVMRETVAPCNLSWREMGRGDQNGLRALYPAP